MTHPPVNEEGAPLVDQTTLHQFQERHPFSEAELEILVRCHEHYFIIQGQSSFLVTMATASPYSVFFLPDYTVEDRVTWLEEHVLPAGFSHLLYTAIFIADNNELPSLEQFLEGMADTRRPKEALRVLYRCCEGSIDPEAAVADLAVRLVVATQLWQSPEAPETNAFVQEFQDMYQPTIVRLTEHLRNYTNQQHEHAPQSSHITTLTERIFVQWAEENFPMLYKSLGCLIHNLLFHGLHKDDADDVVGDSSNNMSSWSLPEFNSPSEIATPGLAMSLAWMDPCLAGKFHRLYSSFYDGRSFNRLLHAIVGYEGPTCVMIRTTNDAVLGAFTDTRWRACRDTSSHHASDVAFLFTLEPTLNVYRTQTEGGNKQHVWYLYSHELLGSITHLTSPEGLGWGGTSEMPRLWIPWAFEGCHAGGWDRTYQQGPLLPDECCERFEIKCLEVWAVGGEERIEHGLAKQATVRQQTKHTLDQARVVHDKRVFVQDLQQMPLTKVFQHQAMARGRHDFVLDEKHGGYKIEE